MWSPAVAARLGALTVTLTKHHGLGNGFLVAVEPGRDLDADDARTFCDRHTGIGADGLVVGWRRTGGADLAMTLRNADGSQAEISGNGLRCLVQAAVRAGVVAGPTVVVDSGAGRHRNRVVSEPDAVTLVIESDLGPVTAIDVPPAAAGVVPGALKVAAARVGNPHVVVLVDAADPLAVAEVGPRLEACFAGGVNVHVVRAVDGGLTLDVWERGVGVTRACGSGAAVSAALAHQWGLVGDRVAVTMPGGTATVDVGDGTVALTGPAVHVATVTVP